MIVRDIPGIAEERVRESIPKGLSFGKWFGSIRNKMSLFWLSGGAGDKSCFGE